MIEVDRLLGRSFAIGPPASPDFVMQVTGYDPARDRGTGRLRSSECHTRAGVRAGLRGAAPSGAAPAGTRAVFPWSLFLAALTAGAVVEVA